MYLNKLLVWDGSICAGWIYFLTNQWWTWIIYSWKYTWECLWLNRHKNIEYLPQHITMNKSMIVWFISVRWIYFLTNQSWNWLVYSCKYTWECLCPNRNKNIEYVMRHITMNESMIVWCINLWQIFYLMFIHCCWLLYSWKFTWYVCVLTDTRTLSI